MLTLIQGDPQVIVKNTGNFSHKGNLCCCKKYADHVNMLANKGCKLAESVFAVVFVGIAINIHMTK